MKIPSYLNNIFQLQLYLSIESPHLLELLYDFYTADLIPIMGYTKISDFPFINKIKLDIFL